MDIFVNLAVRIATEHWWVLVLFGIIPIMTILKLLTNSVCLARAGTAPDVNFDLSSRHRSKTSRMYAKVVHDGTCYRLLHNGVTFYILTADSTDGMAIQRRLSREDIEPLFGRPIADFAVSLT